MAGEQEQADVGAAAPAAEGLSPDSGEEVGASESERSGGGGSSEAGPPSPPEFDLFGEETPAALAAFDGAPEFSISPDEIANLPAPVRHALHNFRTAFLKKSQGLSKERKAIEALKGTTGDQLRKERDELAAARARLLDIFDDPRIKAFAEAPADPEEELDPWTPEGLDHRVRAATATRFQEFLESFQTLSAEEKEKVEKLRAETATTLRQSQLEEFGEENPDFWDMKDEIIAFRSKYNNAIPAEDAYRMLKAMKAPAGPQPPDRSRSREVASRPSRTIEPATAKLPANWNQMSGKEQLEWASENPDAIAAATKRRRLFG